ncbi:MAG TPA: hypothetical protein PLR20_14800 [Syntrophales bacterium]|jgi:prefoldin subunit 5|nr:hypothetical protein [Syntrophales bacterium]
MEKVVQKLMRVTNELNASLSELKKTQDELSAAKAEILVLKARDEKCTELLRKKKKVMDGD